MEGLACADAQRALGSGCPGALPAERRDELSVAPCEAPKKTWRSKAAMKPRSYAANTAKAIELWPSS